MQFIAFAALLIVFGLISCNSQKKTTEADGTQQTEAVSDTIPYVIANNYFINNDVDSVPEVIKTEAEFARCFGMAPVMGEGGKPTSIDFAKQFVIVAAVPPTDLYTEITPSSLKEEDGKLVFNCKITKGEKLSYITHPFVMIAVDKQYEVPVKVVFK